MNSTSLTDGLWTPNVLSTCVLTLIGFKILTTKNLGLYIWVTTNHVVLKGIGNISLKLHDNKTRTLTDVRYVPALKRNLISLGTLDELGFSYKAKNGSMHVFKGDELILTGAKKNGLYVLDGCYFPSINFHSTCIAKTNKTEL